MTAITQYLPFVYLTKAVSKRASKHAYDYQISGDILPREMYFVQVLTFCQQMTGNSVLITL